MKYIKLGRTELKVSRLCFGSLTLGPLQKNLKLVKGKEILEYAFSKGINFVDTAELYETYPYIKQAIKNRDDIIVSTKSYAYSEKGARESFEKARIELDRDIIDIFMIHEQESEHTIRGHYEALEFYLNMKEKGLIKAVGISTHHIAGVNALHKYPEIDIIHPILNKKGIGICDGSLDEMIKAVKAVYEKDIGVFSMKPLGGGNLISDYSNALDFVFDLGYVHSIAIGMQSYEEIDMNIEYMEKRIVSEELQNKIKKIERKLHIEDWCTRCGKCIERCGQGALIAGYGKPKIDHEKCVLCGYCSSVCKDFAIKVF